MATREEYWMASRMRLVFIRLCHASALDLFVLLLFAICVFQYFQRKDKKALATLLKKLLPMTLDQLNEEFEVRKR